MYVRDFCGVNRWPDAPRRFGIEIECEGAGRSRLPDPDIRDAAGWQTVNDGSLRNHGVEFITNPYELPHVETCLRNFYSWDGQFNYESTIRTSTHIHANMQDADINQVAALCALHLLVEPLLFKFCGPQREKNIYCVPWYQADQMEIVQQMVREQSFHPVMRACKYSSLFLSPLGTFGTVEFRHAPFFKEEELAFQWLHLVSSLVFSSLTLFRHPADVLEMYDNIGANAFVTEIFGEEGAEYLRKAGCYDFEQILEEYDTPLLLSATIDSLCTYKVREWMPAQPLRGDASNVEGYRRYTQRPGYNPAYDPEWDHDEFPEGDFYPEEDI